MYIYIFTTGTPKTKRKCHLCRRKRVISDRRETQASVEQAVWRTLHPRNLVVWGGPELIVAPVSS